MFLTLHLLLSSETYILRAYNVHAEQRIVVDVTDTGIRNINILEWILTAHSRDRKKTSTDRQIDGMNEYDSYYSAIDAALIQ